MLTLHPLHTRRIKILAMKATKGQMPSIFLPKMKEEATDAKICDLTEVSVTSHDSSISDIKVPLELAFPEREQGSQIATLATRMYSKDA